MDGLNIIKFDAEFDVKNITLVKHAGETDGKWVVEGYGSTSDLDSQDNIVTPEAIKMGADSLQKYNTLLFNHDADRPIGLIAMAEARDEGLWMKCIISKTEPKIWGQVKDGTLSKFSIRGRVTDYDMLTDELTQKTILMIKGMELYEVSLVSVPANPHAKALGWYIEKAIMASKQAPMTKEDVAKIVSEVFLQEAILKKDQEKLTSAIKILEASLDSLDGEDKDSIKSIIRSLAAIVSRLYTEPAEDTKKSVDDKGGLETVEEIETKTEEIKKSEETTEVKTEEVKTEEIKKSETPVLDLSALKDVIVQLQAIAKEVNSQSETVKSALGEVSKSKEEITKTKDEIAKMVGDLNKVVSEIPLRKAQAPEEDTVKREEKKDLIKSLEETPEYQKASPGDKLQMYFHALESEV